VTGNRMFGDTAQRVAEPGLPIDVVVRAMPVPEGSVREVSSPFAAKGVGRHIAVEIRHAVDKAVAVIAERRPAGGQHGAPLTEEG